MKLPKKSKETVVKEAMRQQRMRAEEDQREKKNRVKEFKDELKTMI